MEFQGVAGAGAVAAGGSVDCTAAAAAVGTAAAEADLLDDGAGIPLLFILFLARP